MKIQKFVLSLCFMFLFVFSVYPNIGECPEGESQAKAQTYMTIENGQYVMKTDCPMMNGQEWCCYDPC